MACLVLRLFINNAESNNNVPLGVLLEAPLGAYRRLKILFNAAIISQTFKPKGYLKDLVETCFPYNLCPSFMPPIGFCGYC